MDTRPTGQHNGKTEVIDLPPEGFHGPVMVFRQRFEHHEVFLVDIQASQQLHKPLAGDKHFLATGHCDGAVVQEATVL